MDRPNDILVAEQRALKDINLEGAARTFKPLTGRVVVLMDPKVEKVGSLYLPDEAQGKERPDTGVVLASGDEWLTSGARVMTRAYHGAEVEGWKTTHYTAEDNLKFFGVVCDWHDSIFCIITDDGYEPLHDWVLIDRDDKTDKQGEIYLPDKLAHRPCMAQVLAFGPECKNTDRLAGRVFYSPSEVFKIGSDKESRAFVKESNIYSQVNE